MMKICVPVIPTDSPPRQQVDKPFPLLISLKRREQQCSSSSPTLLWLLLFICLFLSSTWGVLAFSQGPNFLGAPPTSPLIGFLKTQYPKASDSHAPGRHIIGGLQELRGAPRGAPLLKEELLLDGVVGTGVGPHVERFFLRPRRSERTKLLCAALHFTSQDLSATVSASPDSGNFLNMPCLSPGAFCHFRPAHMKLFETMQKTKERMENRGLFGRIFGRLTDDAVTADAIAMTKLAERLHDWNANNQNQPGKTKLIIAMRHAESTFNVWRRESFTKLRFRDLIRRDWGEADVPLSPQGREQCKRANVKLAFLLTALRDLENQKRKAEYSKATPFHIDTFLVSPLTRALETAANSMYGIDSKWSCASPTGQEQASEATESNNVTWLVDPLLREKISTMGDVGLERQALSNRVVDLHSQGKLESSSFDFGLIPERDQWWVPHTADQLQALIKNLSASQGCGSCLSDTASTAPSENGEVGTDNGVLQVGRSARRTLSAAETSVRNAFEAAARPSRRTAEVDRRMAEWHASNSTLPIYQTVPNESNYLLRLRAKLLLSILCGAKEANAVFIVTHSLFLKALTGDTKFSNAEIRAYTLVCGEKPKLIRL